MGGQGCVLWDRPRVSSDVRGDTQTESEGERERILLLTVLLSYGTSTGEREGSLPSLVCNPSLDVTKTTLLDSLILSERKKEKLDEKDLTMNTRSEAQLPRTPLRFQPKFSIDLLHNSSIRIYSSNRRDSEVKEWTFYLDSYGGGILTPPLLHFATSVLQVGSGTFSCVNDTSILGERNRRTRGFRYELKSE